MLIAKFPRSNPSNSLISDCVKPIRYEKKQGEKQFFIGQELKYLTKKFEKIVFNVFGIK